jgi:beta-mannosidase
VADDDLRRSAVNLGYDDSAWTTIGVPSHWQQHPAFADNDSSVLYRTKLTIDPPAEGRRRWVCFDGIFYQADVFFDGAYLGDHEGYFVPAAFEVTDLARLTDEHVIAVEVACPPQRPGADKRTITGVFQASDIVPPSWNPGGIWRPASIVDTGAVRIDRLRVLCRDANASRAHLRLRSRLDSVDALQVKLRTLVDGEVVDEQEHSLARGANEVAWNIDIDDPQLWWPWSLGDQPLTEITVEAVVDGAASDERSVRTGLREVAMHDWQFSVNGERMFLKGACLAPTAAAMATVDAATVRRDVELARDAGLDLLRVYGHIARPEMYEAADELGMLLWQDHPLQHEYARSARKQAVTQAEAAVDVLGHHPSVIVWCAHDEPMGPRSAPPSGSRKAMLSFFARHQVPSWNRMILDRWVKRSFERADESRPCIAHSGVMPNLPLLDGTDSHLFFGWSDGEVGDLPSFAAMMPRMVRFVSEFGAQSVPTTDEFVGGDQWPYLDWDRLVAEHGMQRDAFERHTPHLQHDRYESWRTATQTYQADLVRRSVETLRRLKYRPTGGFCVFVLNDSAPMISASLLDHERAPKLAYQALVEACRPVIVVADHLPSSLVSGATAALDIHAVNDTRSRLEQARCTAVLEWQSGSHTWSWQGDVPEDACTRIGTIQFVVPDVPGPLRLDLTLEHGELVSTNRYDCTIARREST